MRLRVTTFNLDGATELEGAEPLQGWHGDFMHSQRAIFGARVGDTRYYWPAENVSEFRVSPDDAEPAPSIATEGELEAGGTERE